MTKLQKSNLGHLEETLIAKFVPLIPGWMLPKSGKAFYSGRAAFSAPSPLYTLGLNPGGSPNDYGEETVELHTKQVLTTHPPNWSAFRDEI